MSIFPHNLQPEAKNTEFDEFCGAWSHSDAEQFDTALREMRRIDPGDWELAG